MSGNSSVAVSDEVLTTFVDCFECLSVGHYGTVTLGIWKANGSEVAVKEIDKAKYSSLVALRNEVRIMQVCGNRSYNASSCCKYHAAGFTASKYHQLGRYVRN